MFFQKIKEKNIGGGLATLWSQATHIEPRGGRNHPQDLLGVVFATTLAPRGGRANPLA